MRSISQHAYSANYLAWSRAWIWLGLLAAPGALSRAHDPLPTDPLLTVAESSGFRATSRSDEVTAFVDRVVARVDHVWRLDFGTTVEGRPLVAAVVASGGFPEPAQRADDQRAVVLLLGNIHSGECAGKEALLMLLRELAADPQHPWLRELVLVIVPNFNADGNDRMSPDNRPGQIGPELGMGTRHNAQRLDLNRDFVKLDSPECRALVQLIDRWDPHLFIDLHTTNGSLHRYALTYDVPHNPASPQAVRQYLRSEMMPRVTERLRRQGIATFYYGNFDADHTRWTTYGDEPRYSTEYVGMRGRLAILSEAYSYISYEERIIASREFVRACVDDLSHQVSAVRTMLASIRAETISAGTQPQPHDLIAIQSRVAPLPDKVLIEGYARAQTSSGASPSSPEPHDYWVDFLAHYEPTLSVPRPSAYLLPADATNIAQILSWHGVDSWQLPEDMELDVEAYRVEQVEQSPRVYQGHTLLRVTAEQLRQRRLVRAGTHVIPTAQPLGTLLVYLLEPASRDGLATWNLWSPELTAGSLYPALRLLSPIAR